VTPSFYCFNIILLLRGNVRKKKQNSTEGNLCFLQIVVFPSLQEMGSAKFFANCCAFPFSDAKCYGLKKTWDHRVNFLVISDISEKSGPENPFGMLPW